MPKVAQLTPDQFKDKLRRRFEGAKRYREVFESKWIENYNIIMNDSVTSISQINLTFDASMDLQSGEVDQGDSEIGMNYAFKHLRFFHSQLSANTPSVVAKPTSSDPSDHQKADAADRLVRHGKRKEHMDDYVDQQSWNTLWSGNGWVKGVWNPDIGEIFDFNEDTREVLMEGSIEYTTPSVMDIWIDPDAKTWEKVKYMHERHTISVEEAVFRWPAYEEKFKEIAEKKNEMIRSVLASNSSSEQEPQVEIFEYYEKGMPVNGGAGAHCYYLDDYTILGEITKNPHFQQSLPYHLFTYIDIPDTVYGKSIVEYVSRLQMMLNKLDTTVLDAIQAHGVIRMAVPANSEIEDEAISNTNWDWIKFSGGQAPHFINSPALMPDIWKFRESLLTAMSEIFGINDSMLGIQKREQSAISQQTSIETGTMIHRRLWKKYSLNVESIYRDYLGLIRENWDEPRMILVVGKGRAFEASKFKGADIAGGFDIDVEYGSSLPLDPNMRRESITLLTPLLKEAGMSAKAILQKMKLNDLEGIHDRMELSADRQREDFDEMIAAFRQGTPIYIAPKELQEHQGRLDYSYTYLETAEFKYLDEELKAYIEKNVLEREALMKEQAAPTAAPDPSVMPAGSPGVGGAMGPSVGGGSTSAQEVTSSPQSISGAGIT